MERKDREGSLGKPKQEPLSSPCSYSSFAKDKENSEPMDIGSPPPSAAAGSILEEEANSEPQSTTHQYPPPLLSNKPSATSTAITQSVQQKPVVAGSSRSSMIHLSNGTTPDAGRSAIGTPQSLSQIINNLPSSNFSFDLGELQSPVGSGFISPGTTKLGKKRPLSISPLSSSSINIDALVRGSPTSLLNFITTQSRNSSAGSFGHLSPSLYATPSNNHCSFNRPTISLSKPVHPPLFHSAGVAALPFTASTATRGDKTSSDNKMTMMKSELADIADHDASIQPIMRASLEHESEGELILPASQVETHNSIYHNESTSENESKPFQRHNRRIYYSYPAIEEPHNNCCMWEGCQSQFESLDQLVMHVNSDHIYQESRKEFVCAWSGCVRERRPFKAQYMLLVHMRRHTGEKPHRCHYQGCEKAYSRLENLKTHLRSHTGEKPYLCKYEGCGKAFSNASDCAKHMNRTHSDEKPYGCLNPGCMKRYTDPSSRRKHMKNCQVNKKARTGGDSTSGPEGEENTMDTRPLPESGTTIKKTTTKPKKNEKKRKEESWSSNKPTTTGQQHTLIDQFPTSQNNLDMGYMSGESQCTPGSSLMAALTKGRTQLSGYNSSGYDTEYPSLPEDMPPLIITPGNETDTFYDNCIIKREQFSPSSQMEHYPYQLSQPPPPPPYTHGLQPLPEVYHQYQHHHHHHHHQYSAFPNGGVMEGSSDYSSFGGSPMINNDDTSSMMSSSFNGSSQTRSIKESDLSNGSHSSFSTLSSRLSSPISTTNRSIVAGRGDYSKHSYRNLRPPDLILRPQQPSYSVQMSDIKGGPPNCYKRQSDELSLRSSHSSRYSGSEYSDDMTRVMVGPPPPLPHPDTHSSSRGEPLPLPQSMQRDFVISDMVATTTNMYMSKEMSPVRGGGGHTFSSPSSGGYHIYTPSNNSGGMVPLKHYEPLHKQPPLPMIFESQVQSDTPNMVIGNMSINASQLQQDNLLLESLSSSHPFI